MSDFMRTLCKIAIPVCLQKEAERPLTVEIWTRWAGVLCLFSEYNGEPDLLFRLAQVERAAIGDGHVQLIERTGGKFRYSLAVLVCDPDRLFIRKATVVLGCTLRTVTVLRQLATVPSPPSCANRSCERTFLAA